MERMITGIKPSNFSPTLGNYLGCIKPAIAYQDQYELFIFIADLHALTVHQKPEELQQNIKNLVAVYLAAGLDPNKSVIFRQSEIPAHNQLEWVLTCNTNLSELTNMPQYKNYVLNSRQASSAGMLMYPSLMNADILLYDADCVPTGIDQVPHVELTRDIAEVFNRRYGETFKLPRTAFQNTSARIKSLSDPTRKMSKSESDKGTIYLLEDIDISRYKLMKALTDGENAFRYDPSSKPGLSNLIAIYGNLTGMDVAQVVDRFQGCENYGVFKRELADVLCETLLQIQLGVQEVLTDNYWQDVLKRGREIAQPIADSKVVEVYSKIGLNISCTTAR